MRVVVFANFHHVQNDENFMIKITVILFFAIWPSEFMERTRLITTFMIVDEEFIDEKVNVDYTCNSIIIVRDQVHCKVT